MKDNQKVYLGVLGKTKGLKGELRLHLYNADSSNVSKGLNFWIEGEGETLFEVLRIAPHQKTHLLKIKNFENVDLVKKWVGKKIFVMRDQLEDTQEGQYYHVDLVGCQAFNKQGQAIGIVKEVLVTGANDVLSIIDAQSNEILVPFIDPYVLEVDLEKQRIQVIVPEIA